MKTRILITWLSGLLLWGGFVIASPDARVGG
jgi:hypothetical protein